MAIATFELCEMTLTVRVRNQVSSAIRICFAARFCRRVRAIPRARALSAHPSFESTLSPCTFVTLDDSEAFARERFVARAGSTVRALTRSTPR